MQTSICKHFNFKLKYFPIYLYSALHLKEVIIAKKWAKPSTDIPLKRTGCSTIGAVKWLLLSVTVKHG